MNTITTNLIIHRGKKTHEFTTYKLERIHRLDVRHDSAAVVCSIVARTCADARRNQAIARRIESIEKNAKQAAPDAALADRVEQVELRSKDAVVLGDIPNSFRLPNSDTSLHIYGFAELNMVKEFKGDNSDQDYSTFHCRGLTLIANDGIHIGNLG
ncbi:hypothetical protein ACFQAT_09775 [Undibacterium arcticum]|uniref:hypothetical protein n=1 Tax=Undibacterium arcticum TaxID=1762892 RepID=UPI00361FF1EB